MYNSKTIINIAHILFTPFGFMLWLLVINPHTYFSLLYLVLTSGQVIIR